MVIFLLGYTWPLHASGTVPRSSLMVFVLLKMDELNDRIFLLRFVLWIHIGVWDVLDSQEAVNFARYGIS